jgi:hypothetical protein
MTNEKLYEILGDISDKHIGEAQRGTVKAKKRTLVKWTAMAACICLVIAGGFLFRLRGTSDFNSMLGEGSEDTATILETVDTVSFMTTIPVDKWMARYEQMNVSGSELEQYVGNEYLKIDSVIWYYQEGMDNLKYLIRKDQDDLLTLWMFTSFETEENETYTYGDVLSTIYGVESAEDIVSITGAPSVGNNTDLGKQIQKEVGTHTYSDREDIAAFYDIVKNVVCFGADSESVADENRFTYSFSTDSQDKLTSGESTYAMRSLTVTLENGTTIDSWHYDALSGSFSDYGGVFTQPLSDESVSALNQIFGIK